VPSKDDLSEQLNLTTKLAAQVERMAAAAEKLEQTYTQQVATLTQVAQALGTLNVQGSVQQIQTLNQSLQQMQQKMKDTSKAGENAFKTLGQKVLESGKKFAQSAKSISVGTAALTGFWQGVKNTVSLTKAVGSFFSSFIGGVASLTVSILSIPLKIFEGLVDMAAQGAGGSNELMQALENLRKEFGAFYGPTNKAIIDTSKSLKGFSDTGLSAWRVFGNMAQRLEYIQKLASDMGRSFLLLRQEMEDNGGAILAYQKGLGLSGESMKAVTLRANAMGTTAGDVLKEMTQYSISMGNALKIDAKVMSRDMGEAMKDIAHFGNTNIKVMAESTAYMHKFGLEVKDTTGILDTFMNFEDATAAAAKMQQAFGANIDVMKVMKKSAEGDVGGAMEELRKAFKDAGVDGAKLDNIQKKIIRDATHMTDEQIQNALAMKNQGKSLKDVQMAGDRAQKKTLSQAEAMGKLSDAIERMVMAGGGMHGGFWDQFVAGIKNGIMGSKDFVGIMFKIRAALRQVYMIGVQLGRALVEIVPGLKDIGKGLNQFFDPTHFTKLFKGISEAVQRFFGSDPRFKSYKGNVPEMFRSLQKVIKDFFFKEGPHARQILEGFKKFFMMMSHIAAEAIKILFKTLAESMHDVASMIRGESPVPGMGGARGAIAGGLGFLKDMLTPIIEALKEAWTVFLPALKDLAGTLWEKFVDFMKKPEVMSKVKMLLAGVAGLLFGPAFTRAAIGALTAALGKAAGTLLEAGLKKAFPKLFAKVTEAAANTKGMESATGQLGTVKGVVKAENEVMAEDKKGNWGAQDAIKLGLKLIAIATAIAVGGVEMAAAIVAMKAIMGDLTVTDVLPQILVLGALVVAAVPLMLALKLASQVGKPSEIIKGGLAIALGVGIVAVTAGVIAGLLGLITTPAMLDAVGTMMLKMSLVFLAMVPLIVAAMAIGALASGPQAILLGAAAVGLEVIGVAVAEMAAVAMGIVQELNKMTIDATFQRKIDAFLGVMKAIQSFTDALVKVIELMQPTLVGFLTGTEEKFTDKINAAQGAIKTMIGESGRPGGIVGMVETVMKQIGKIKSGGPHMAESAQIFGTVMTAMADVMKAMTPPDAFFEAGTGLLNKLANPTVEFADLTFHVGKYAEAMRTQMMKMIEGEGGKGGVLGLLKDLSGIKIPDPSKAKIVADMLTSIASVTKAITPDPETLKTISDSGGKMSVLWGVFSKDDTKKGASPDDIAKLIGAKAAGIKTLIDAITTGPMKAVLDQASGLKGDQLKGIDLIGVIMKSTTDFIAAVSSANKGNTGTVTIDKEKTTMVMEQVPDLTTVITQMGTVLPDFMKQVEAMVSAVPVDKDFTAHLEKAQKLMDFIGGVPKLADSLQNLSANAPASGAANTNPLLAAVASVSDFFKGLVGASSDNPVSTMMNSVQLISAMLTGGKGTPDPEKTFTNLSKLFGSVDETAKNFSMMSDSLTAASAKMKGGAIKPAIDAVNDMIDNAKKLNAALADGDLNKINVKANLQKVASAVGLGGKANYSIENKGVTINVSFNVTMRTDDVEKAIITNAKSVIADRLAFATDRSPGKKAQTPLAAQIAAPFSETVPEK